MTHASGHHGTDPNNPDDWTDEAWAEEQKKKATPSIVGNLPEGATYSQYVTIRRNYPNLTPEEQVKFERLKNYYTLVYGRAFLDDQSFTIIKDGQPTEIGAGEASVLVAYVMSERVLTGSIPDPMEATLQDEVETEEQPNTLRIRVMQQKSEDGITWTEPVDVNVQLTEAQYDFLSASSAWDGLADVDEKTRIITTHTNNWWDLRVILQDVTAMGLEGTYDPGDESDPNFDPSTAGGDAESMLAAIFAKANGAVSVYNPYNPRNDGLPAIPAEFAKTGITWSIDPITGTRELVDTKPWEGPPAGALRWLPNDPVNDPMGAGNWRVDPEEQLNLQATMWEGVPGAVRPWLQAVLDAGGDLNILNQALPKSVRDAIMSKDPAGMMGQLSDGDRGTLKQHDILRSWIGFILGQARASSDPEFGSPILKDSMENWIPLGSGEVPAKEFDQLLPNFLSSLTPGESKKQPAAATAQGPGKSAPPAATTSGSGTGAGSTGGASAGAGSGAGAGAGSGSGAGAGGGVGGGPKAGGPATQTKPQPPAAGSGAGPAGGQQGPAAGSQGPAAGSGVTPGQYGPIGGIYAGIANSILDMGTQQVGDDDYIPGTALPPGFGPQGELPSAGYDGSFKDVVPEISGDGILGAAPDDGTPRSDAYLDNVFGDYTGSPPSPPADDKGVNYVSDYNLRKIAEEAFEKGGSKTETGIWKDNNLGSGELGGDTGGGGFWGSAGKPTGTVAAAMAAAKAKAEKAAAIQKAKDDEELARIAAMGG
tara:strand:- start:2672 stop:4960 length:2289 start_codon:yes stop_codon:yes gene_type:complete